MAIQRNDSAKYALIAGIACYPLYLVGCVVPFAGLFALIAAGAAVGMGFKGVQFANVNDGDGKTESMIGAALGGFALVMAAIGIVVGLLAIVGLVITS